MELSQISHAPLVRDLQPIVLNTSPMQRWIIDLIDVSNLYSKFNGPCINFVLNVIDQFSKWVWSRPLKSKLAATVALQMQNIILFEGQAPEMISCDDGSEFKGEMNELAQKFSIRLQRSQPYSSNVQGCVERFNGTMRSAFIKYLAEITLKNG